jgi:hypothetical protein
VARVVSRKVGYWLFPELLVVAFCQPVIYEFVLKLECIFVYLKRSSWRVAALRPVLELVTLVFVSHCIRYDVWEAAAAGLERGPLSLVRTTEELLEGKVAAPD